MQYICTFLFKKIPQWKYHDEVMALGLTISKSIWLRCAYTLAILDGVENIVDDHQTFP